MGVTIQAGEWILSGKLPYTDLTKRRYGYRVLDVQGADAPSLARENLHGKWCYEDVVPWYAPAGLTRCLIGSTAPVTDWRANVRNFYFQQYDDAMAFYLRWA